MAVDVRLATPEDAAWFAPRLRASDTAELTAASGPGILATLTQSIEAAPRRAFVAETDGEPMALFGFVPWGMLSNTASPWMVGTDTLLRHGRALVRLGRAYCEAAEQEHPVLVNFVDVRNTASVRWLKRLGFKFDAPAPYGLAGLPFMRFSNV